VPVGAKGKGRPPGLARSASSYKLVNTCICRAFQSASRFHILAALGQTRRARIALGASCWGACTVAWPISTVKSPLSLYLQYLSVLVKLGEQGSLLVPAVGDPIRQPAVMAPAVVDTTGAGDTFTAAYAVATLEGNSPADALAFAGTFQACITSGRILMLCCLTFW
jgi:hypothetical protein